MAIIYSDVDFMTVAQIKEEIGWPLDYTSTKNLIPYINRLKDEKLQGIEIGTGRGEGSYLILGHCPKVTKITTIDPFEEFDDWVGKIELKDQLKFEEIAKKNLSEFGPRVSTVHAKSDDSHNLFENDSVDFVFVDGDHSKDQVYRDCKNYYPKLKKGGIFAVHDHALGSVREGLIKFRDENKVRIPLNLANRSLAFWYKV